MNKINFAKPGINKKNRRARSKVASIFLITAALITMATLQIKQWKALRNIKKERNISMQHVATLDQVIKEKNQLVEQEEILKHQVEKIEKIKKNQQPYLTLFSEIERALGSIGSLESLSIQKKNLNMTVNWPTIKNGTDFIQTIANLPSIASIKLISMRPDTNGMLFNLHGSIQIT